MRERIKSFDSVLYGSKTDEKRESYGPKLRKNGPTLSQILLSVVDKTAYLGGNVCAKILSDPLQLGPRAKTLRQEVHFSYHTQLSDRQELLRSSRNLSQKMTPWHKEHSDGLCSQDHILRTQARLCARPVPLKSRVFLTRNKLICEPGHVGKKTHPCTTWNSRIAKNLSGSSRNPDRKTVPQTDQKHPGGLCSRGHISQVQARIPANPEPCKSRQRKLSDGTKNVKIRHRELGQICARTGTRFEKKRAGSKTHFFSRTAAFARKSFLLAKVDPRARVRWKDNDSGYRGTLEDLQNCPRKSGQKTGTRAEIEEDSRGAAWKDKTPRGGTVARAREQSCARSYSNVPPIKADPPPSFCTSFARALRPS
uniref:Uncharacterized protein n=1 Tax=Fagus sylvatica TaxID=28930 RepID=A0A2N9ES27_FAGSY